MDSLNVTVSYVGRKSQYQPMWLNTDLQATNITVE